MIIDFGGHFYPGGIHSSAITENPDATKIDGLLTTPKELLSYIEATPLDRMVLSQPYYMGSDDVTATEKANRSLLETVAKHDELYSLAAVPINAGGEVAATELERSLEHGCNGGAVEVSPYSVGLTDKEYEPVLEVADKFGAPILVHPKLNGSIHPKVFDGPYRINAIFGREFALMQSLCLIVQQDLVASYPNIRFVYHHFGGNIASMFGRIELQYDTNRWESSPQIKEFDEFARIVRDHIYIDTSGFFGHETPLWAALKEFSSRNILFGSDYPYETRTSSEMTGLVRSVQRVGDETEQQKILGENAQRILLHEKPN